MNRMQTATTPPRALPLGDAALTFEFGAGIDLATHARVMGFAAVLEVEAGAGRLPGVVEWVPAYASLTVFFDPAADELDALRERLLDLACHAQPVTRGGTQWNIPVCFDAELGPDLDGLAQARGLGRDEVVALMTGTEFRVYMLGFLPGFPYLGGLPAACEMPRLATPRRAVPERSIAVAGRMCAVYPWESPGGWHLLGRTPLRLFDVRDPLRPALFAPGDLVRWEAIDADTYHELDRLAARGALPREHFIAGGGEALVSRRPPPRPAGGPSVQDQPAHAQRREEVQ